MKSTLLPILTFAKVDIRRAFRDKVALFFTFVFPLIFLFVFGGIFGSDNDVSFKIAISQQSDTDIAAQVKISLESQKIFEIDTNAADPDVADEKLTRSELDAIIIIPEEFGVESQAGVPRGELEVRYTQNNEQAAQALASILDQQLNTLNSQFVDTTTPFSVVTRSTATESQRRFDYTFAGLLGFSILSLGIFGPTNVFPQLKKQGVLRRYHTTTLRVWQYFSANVLSQAIIGILSVALLFVVARIVFDLNMNGDYISLASIVVLGVVVLFGIGLAIGGWAKNENQAAPLANLVTFPMMFLSGTFFPRFAMPEWLQTISGFLPLTPVIDSARLIITEGRTLFELGPQLAILAVWGIVIYVIAFRVFRWE